MTSFSVRKTCGLPSLALLLLFAQSYSIANAQQRDNDLRGYITHIEGLRAFDVDGVHVVITDLTQVEVSGKDETSIDGQLKDAVHYGAGVDVVGPMDKKTKTIQAYSVKFNEAKGKKYSGLGLVLKVITHGTEPLLLADGYKIRIKSETQSQYSGDLKKVEDVSPGVWIRYDGNLDEVGILTATKAHFFRRKRSENSGSSGVQQNPVAGNPNDTIDSDGIFHDPHTKVRASDMGVCGLHRLAGGSDSQERVQRVGMSVVPAYQKLLPDDSPAKIHFRFYVVHDDAAFTEIPCNRGLILIPERVLTRLKNDDQLAAVLADGIIFYLQLQSIHVVDNGFVMMSGVVAALYFSEAALRASITIPISVAVIVIEDRVQRALQEQRGRIALALLADAGYDPWQAPEAWRLLMVRKLPADPSTLKYPSGSGYQLGILHLLYKKDGGINASPAIASLTQ